MNFKVGSVLPFPLSKGFLFRYIFFRETHRFGKLYHVMQPIPARDVSRDLKTSPEEGDETLTCSLNFFPMNVHSVKAMTTLTETSDLCHAESVQTHR